MKAKPGAGWDRSPHLTFQVVSWSFFLVLDLLMLVAIEGGTGRKVANIVIGLACAGLVSEGIYQLFARIGWSDRIRFRLLALVVGLCVGGGALVAGVMRPVEAWANPFAVGSSPGPTGFGGLWVFYAMTLLLWALFAAAGFFYQRSRRAETAALESAAAAREAELRALRMQINPHFLFNAFATLRALVELDPARAKEAITRLSAMMRYALSEVGHRTVSLGEELEMVESYLHIEKLRLQDRLAVCAAIEPETRTLAVPPLCVQVLVENAVKYGPASRRDGGMVGYSAGLHQGCLSIVVTNPGVLAEHRASSGVGLVNLRSRLSHLYGDAGTLSLRQAGPGQIRAEVRIPVAGGGR